MRIDAHIHITPPDQVAEIVADAEGEPFWALLLGGRATPPVLPDERRTIADMDRAGVDCALVQGEYYRRHERCVARNRRALALARRFPGRLAVFACVQPTAGAAAVEEIRRCAAEGAVGVGELNAYAQGFRLDDPDFLRVAETCAELGLPLTLHGSEPVGHYYPGKSTTPLAQYYRLAARLPELKLILAHWGGGLVFYELMPAARHALRNVWYDTAASPLLYPTAAIFDVALRCVPQHKILFATDYPLRLYRGADEPGFGSFIAEVDALGLAPDILADLMGRNAARLIGRLPALPPEVPPTPARPSRVIVDVAPGAAGAIVGAMAVGAVAGAWPATRAIFERHRIAWEPDAAPFWEPIAQAAAARGMGPAALTRLLVELNEAASG